MHYTTITPYTLCDKYLTLFIFLSFQVLAAFSEAGSDMVLIDVSFAEETRAYRVYLREQNITVLYPHVPLSLAAGMEYIRCVL